jgi:hypothetical protein
MNNQLTDKERSKIHEITQRLNQMTSPVLRLQAILQFSMIVDTLMLGDTGQVDHDFYMNTICNLEDRVAQYEQQEQSESNADTAKHKLHTHEEQANTVGGEETPADRPHPQAACPRGAAAAVSSLDELTGSDDVA